MAMMAIPWLPAMCSPGMPQVVQVVALRKRARNADSTEYCNVYCVAYRVAHCHAYCTVHVSTCNGCMMHMR